MLQDLRIRNSNRPTKIPASYRAFVFGYPTCDGATDVEVIIAPDRLHAEQRLKDFCYEQGLEDIFFYFVGESNFQVVAKDFDYSDILL